MTEMLFLDYLDAAKQLGFEVVLEEAFPYQARYEQYCILWHPDGALLEIDSFGGRLNEAILAVNWLPPKESMRNRVWVETDWSEKGGFWNYPSINTISIGRSGTAVQWDEDRNLFISSYHVREGLRRHWTELQNTGSMVTPWVEAPIHWLCTYAEEHELHAKYPHDSLSCLRAYEAITLDRWNRFPEYVKEATQVLETDSIKAINRWTAELSIR